MTEPTETTPPTPNLLHIARAVDGDDWFVSRIRIAARLVGYPFSDLLALHVAYAVQDDIHVDENRTVDTSGVQDADIVAAVSAFITANPLQTAPVPEHPAISV